jgi:hypothetical protein
MTMIYSDNEPRVKRQKYDFAMKSTHSITFALYVWYIKSKVSNAVRTRNTAQGTA